MSDLKFGFRVRADVSLRAPADTWEVYLPHQCSHWEITGFRDSHEAAVANLEEFIAEAQDALAALREHRAFGEDD